MRKGSHHTVESREQMSESHKGHKTGMTSKHFSEESKKQMSLSHKGQHSSPTTEFKKGHKRGMLGKHHSEEARLNISDGHKGQIPWSKGKHLSEETKKKISVSLKGKIPWIAGKHHTEESKATMSAKRLGRSGWNKGIPLSEETKQKLSKALKGKPSPRKGVKYSLELRQKLSLAHKGQKATNPFPKGHTPWNKGLQMSESTKEKVRIARSKQKFPLKDTLIERKIQEMLDSINVKYRKHMPIYHPKMGYHQADIALCDENGEPKIVINCDGCYWHNCLEHCPDSKIGKKQREKDRVIDKCLQELGIKVIRIWEHDIRVGRIPVDIYQH